MKNSQCCHKFQGYNDIHHWPKVVSTTCEIDSIYHMDFSEILSKMHKFEPQSSHFSKSQNSLHCTIKHCPESDHSPHQYMYHLSDVMQHNHAFTAAVVEHILSLEVLPVIIRFKSDDCSTQYKSEYVFSFWSLAKKLSRNVIVYYGVSGHGKGLVDAMSAFGVKNLIRKAAWVEDFSYKKAADIYNYLTQHFDQDTQNNYFLIDEDEISAFQSKKKSYKIEGCQSLHLICYHSDGSIEIIINVCSCEN